MKYFIRYNGKNIKHFSRMRNAGEAFREMLFKADREQAIVELVDEEGNVVRDNRDDE